MKPQTALRITGWLILLVLFPWMVIGPVGPGLQHLWERAASHLPDLIQRIMQPGWMHGILLVLMVLLGTPLIKATVPGMGWGMASMLTALVYGLAYKIALFLPEISSYPFSLSWSEASRYYYASLFLSDSIYGLHVPLSVLHPSRYLLQSVPFLIPNSPLWLHRLWQVCVGRANR
jgi:hypothetical protein